MLPQERQDLIMKELYEYHSVKISELSSKLDVTRETIRKDLYELEEKGLIRKVHGGAVLNKANLETNYSSRKIVNEWEKRAIAKKAVEFVFDNDTIYIDYGTTALYFARELIMKKTGLTIVTNSLSLANELVEHSNFSIIIIGGNVRKNERSLYGPVANQTIANLYVDTGFFGIGALHPEVGYTNIHMGEAEVSRLMVQHSKRRVMMADYSKFGSIHMNKVAPIEEVDTLITDSKADAEMLKAIQEKARNVIVVEAEGGEGDE
ncbi:DeoR/GlpR family DNA-binding transcription regulator [Bacillus sp. FSL W7-1321]